MANLSQPPLVISIGYGIEILNDSVFNNISTLSDVVFNDSLTLKTSQKNWPILSLSLLGIVGTIGNVLVCISITLDKQLQTVTNWFLFSLSIADCLVSVIVVPLSIIKDFVGSWQLPSLVCNIYVFLDVLLCTTSIWHLTAISIDRFLYIARPFRSRERSKRKTFMTIVFIWIFSIAISCAIFLLGFSDEKNILQNHGDFKICALNNRKFIIYGSIICFCIPCILMIIMYTMTIRRLQIQVAKCYSDPDENPTHTDHETDRLRRHRSARRSHTLSDANQDLFLANRRTNSSSSLHHHLTNNQSNITSHRNTPSLTNFSNNVHTRVTSVPLSTISSYREFFTPLNYSADKDNQQKIHQHKGYLTPSTTVPSIHSSKVSLNVEGDSEGRRRSFLHNTLVQKAVHAFHFDSHHSSERKAMKVLGIVFVVFLIAWVPFSFINILSAICTSCNITPTLLNILSWLGYISSNLNPIIYTAFNVRFRRAFFSILTCRLKYFESKMRNNIYVFVSSNDASENMPGGGRIRSQNEIFLHNNHDNSNIGKKCAILYN